MLIPAWCPGPTLGTLVRELLSRGVASIILVDDGSGPSYAPVFDDLATLDGVHLARHAINLGKGRALKTGMNLFLQVNPNYAGLATADADGQHTAIDIVRSIVAFTEDRGRMVLGVRGFDGSVPLRSRVGNAITSVIFRFLTGKKITDTQTGLRVFSTASLAELLPLPGERYEYEMTVLSHVCRTQAPHEVPIETIYLDGNATSHFDPIRDSARIYFVLLRFYASSIFASVLDFAMFTLAFLVTANIQLSFVIGRSSSLVNFTLNRQFVFRTHVSVLGALVRYYLLVAAVSLGAFASLLWLTTFFHWNVIVAKIFAESVLSIVSFSVQRTFVFPTARETRV